MSDPGRARVMVACVGASVAIGVGCTPATTTAPRADDGPALTARTFPGFRLGMPDGTTTGDARAYDDGKVVVTARGVATSVSWHAGTATDDVLHAGVLGFGDTVDKVGPTEMWSGPHGEQVPTVALSTAKGRVILSVIPCGGRAILLINAAETLQHRMLASFMCTPDPVGEASLDALPWTVALPEGWYRVDAPAGQVHLADAHDVLMLSQSPAMPDRNDPAKLQAIVNAGGAHVTVGPWHDDRFPIDMPVGDKTYPGWVMPIACGGQTVLAIGVSLDGHADDLAALVEKKGRCLAAGETAPPWPARR